MSDGVVSLKDFKEKKAQEAVVVKCKPESEMTAEELLELTKKKNAEAKKRLEEERKRANKTIIDGQNLKK